MATRDLTSQFLERRAAAIRKRPAVSHRIISGGGGGTFYKRVRVVVAYFIPFSCSFWKDCWINSFSKYLNQESFFF